MPLEGESSGSNRTPRSIRTGNPPARPAPGRRVGDRRSPSDLYAPVPARMALAASGGPPLPRARHPRAPSTASGTSPGTRIHRAAEASDIPASLGAEGAARSGAAAPGCAGIGRSTARAAPHRAREASRAFHAGRPRAASPRRNPAGPTRPSDEHGHGP